MLKYLIESIIVEEGKIRPTVVHTGLAYERFLNIALNCGCAYDVVYFS